MSSMLEQAIIDAEALKEAAIKNAEAAIIEKYSADIKNAVDSLLEAEDDEDALGEAGLEDEMGLGGELGGGPEEAPADVLPDVTPAAVDGETLCPCPDEQEEVVVDFEQLAAAADAEMGMDPAAPGALDAMGGADLGDELALGGEEEEEELELSESLVDSVIDEILKVDHESVPSGTTGGNAANPAEQEAQTDAALASSRDTEAAKEEKEQAKAIKDLQEKISNLEETRTKAMKIISHLQGKINETNLLNAKLLYTNKILNSDSLNERQKNQVAEAISRADTVEAAKVVYETLQSAVESGRTKRRQPNSLSEAVTRRSSAFMPRRTESLQERNNPETDRWAILAGIKKRD